MSNMHAPSKFIVAQHASDWEQEWDQTVACPESLDGQGCEDDPGSGNSSSSHPHGEAPDPNAELVILVHGTFAASESDQGKSWWQAGSRAWNGLTRRLPAGTRLAERGEVFHWSGENSERARIKAGQDLLTRMTELEDRGRQYHLVGHSHGGSVIWHALRLATLRRQELSRLNSWSTVGTPFLHYRTRSPFSPRNIVNIVLGLILLKPAWGAASGLFQCFFGALMGWNESLHIRSDHDAGLTAILRAPFIKLIEVLGVPVVDAGTVLRVGSHDPTTGESLAHFMFFTREGWVITGVVLLAGYVFLNLAILFLGPVLESLRIRAEKRLEEKVVETYRGRWLGLWSTHDEAINGLRATLGLSISFVSQMTLRERVLLSDYLSLVSRPYYWIAAPLFNSYVRPMLDGAVRSLVVKAAQGNNRPAAEVVAVSPLPIADLEGANYPALPKWLDEYVVNEANKHARDIAPMLREILSEPTFVGGLERFGSSLAGEELVHTSYFDHGEILDLLGLHVAWAQRDQVELQKFQEMQPRLWNWFRQFKICVDIEIGETVDSEAAPTRRSLIRPRRKSLVA